MQVCYEAGYTGSTNTYVYKNLSCQYIQDLTNAQDVIYTSVGQTYTNIDAYYLYVGYIQNPSSCVSPDSYIVTFSGGSPTGTVNQGLTMSYIPNVIANATLTHSSVQAGTTDTYIFKFQITDTIFQNGFIQLSFPDTPTNAYGTTAPQNIASLTSFNIYGTTPTGFSVLNPITTDVTYSGLFSLQQLVPDYTKFITLTITGITNPSSMVTTSSFTITTLDDQQNPIDQVSSGLTITISQPGTLTINSFTVGDQTVGATTFITFTISPSVKYSTGGYIDIILPFGMSVSSTSFSCPTSTGFTTGSSSTCTRVSSSEVQLYGILSKNLLVSLPSVQFSINGITNILGVMQNAPFSIYFKNSDGSIVAQNLTAVQYFTWAGTCTVSSAIRDPSVLTVGLTGAKYTLTFSCPHIIPTAGQLVLQFYDEQVSYSASTTCALSNGNSLACTLAQGTGYFNVTISGTALCGSSACSANTALTVVLVNAKNPSYINSPLTKSVQIFTYNSISSTFVMIDNVTSGVYFTNSLNPGTLTNVVLTRSGSVLTGGVPSYLFSFTTATILPNGAVVVITFPINTAYYDSTLSLKCKVGSGTQSCTSTALSTDSTQISTITVSSLCSSTTCAGGTTFTVTLTNFDNPFSTIANTNVGFTIQTQVSSSNGLVDKASYTASQLSLTPNVLTTSLTAPVSPIVVGDTTTYTFSITTTNQLPSSTSGGSLVIQFPTGTNGVSVLSTSCSAQTSSVTLTCLASTTTMAATITTTTALVGGTTITVQFYNSIQNPQTGAASPTFTIQTLYSTGVIDQSTTLTVTPDTFNLIQNPTSTRDVATVSSNIQMTISFQTTNPIPLGAQIVFYIPSDQAVKSTTQAFSVTDAGGSASIAVVSTLASASGAYSGFVTFAVTAWCTTDLSSTSCPASTTSSILIKGLANPSTAKFPSNSIVIQIYTSASAKIDAVSTNLYTIPNCNYGALTSVVATSSNNIVGQATTLSFTITTPSNGALTTPGYVNILFPASTFFQKSGSPTCIVSQNSNTLSSSCTPTLVSDPNNMGKYLNSIIGNLNCNTITCGNNSVFTFTIAGYYNQYSTKSQTGLIISVSTQAGSGSGAQIQNALDLTIGTDISSTQMPALVPDTIVINSLVRTITSTDTSTAIQFSFTMPTRLAKGGYIYVSLPASQFVPDGNNCQYQQQSGSNYGTAQTLTIVSTSSTATIFAIKEFCSGGNNYCSDGQTIDFQINKGFKNVGYTSSSTTTYVQITTYLSDQSTSVDQVTTGVATPAVTPSTITVTSIKFDNTQAAVTGVNVDFTLKFGATIQSSYYILITFSQEFIRDDAGTITCADYTSGSATTKTCTPTDFTSAANVVNTVVVSGFCSSGCTSTSSYVVRLSNVVNRLYVDVFAGTALIQTSVDSAGASIVSQVSYSLSNVATLTPGILLNSAVTRSVTTQGSNSTFTLTWSTPGYLLPGSNVNLYLPLNQITLASTTYSYADASNAAISFTPQSGTPNSTYYVSSVAQWLCGSTANCAPSTAFTVVITKAKNPLIQTSTYNDFFISHTTTAGKPIFSSAIGLDALPDLSFGVIDNINITQFNQPYVGQTTEYVFTFTVESDIPQGGAVRITFPATRVLQSTTQTMTCQNSASVSYTCTPTYSSGSLSTVVIAGICPNAVCSSPVTYTFTLSGGMMNPAAVFTISGNFIIETLTSSSNGFIVSQGKVANSAVSAILPNPLTVTVTRSSQYLGATNDYHLQFDTVMAIPSTGYVRVIIPTDQVIVPSNGPTCYVDYALSQLSCTTIFKTSSLYYVDIPCPCQNGCAAGTTIQLLLSGTQNPSTFSANSVTDSWSVYTMNSAKQWIDGVSTGVQALPQLVGKTVIVQSVSMEIDTTYNQTNLIVEILPGSDLTTAALIDVYFPNLFAYYRNKDVCQVFIANYQSFACTFTSNATSGYIYKVSLQAPCPLQCYSSTTYVFKIPITNREDNYAVGGQFQVITRYTNIDVGIGYILNTLQATPDTLQQLSVYNDGTTGTDVVDSILKITMSLIPKHFVPTGANLGRIRIVIPSQFQSIGTTCTATINQGSSGMTCKMSGSTAIVTHSSDVVGQNVSIIVQKMVNPASTQPTDPFLVYTERDFNGSGTYYIIDWNLVNMTYQINTSTPFLQSSITRLPLTTTQLGYQTGQPTQLLIQAQLRHALVSTATFIVQFPDAAQLMLNNYSSSATCYQTDAYGNQKNLILCEVINTNNTIIVRNLCQVTSCAVNANVYFKLYDDFVMNYHYVVNPLNQSTDLVMLKSTTKYTYYYVDQAYLEVTPSLIPTSLLLPSPQIIRTNNVINRKVSWVFSFQVNKNQVPVGGVLQMKIPQNVMLVVPNSTITVSDYGTSGTFSNFTSNYYSDGLSVQNITIYDFCTSICDVGDSYSIIIDWIKNPISQLASVSGNITIDLMTPELYYCERGTTPSVDQLFSQLIPVSMPSIYIRPLQPQAAALTSYEMVFSVDYADISPNDSMIITFPPEVNPWPTYQSSTRILNSKASNQNTTTNTTFPALTKACTSMFNSRANVTCTAVSASQVNVTGLFTDGNNQYGLRLAQILNPSAMEQTSTFQLQMFSSSGDTKALRSTDASIQIQSTISDQSTCNKVCGSCAGTTSTCTSCQVPSKYPIFSNFQCVDSCTTGYFFDQDLLQCIPCHSSCNDCFGPGQNNCQTCADGYYNQDGVCVPYCSQGLTVNATTNECQTTNISLCTSPCASCSLNTSYCFSCNQRSSYPILDQTVGKCIPYDQSKCNNSVSSRFYIDESTLTCETCNELCETCTGTSTTCLSCWNFQSKNIVNELYETCVDFCGLGSWYNEATNVCSYCNPICLMCTGYGSDQCLICNSTPEARQLYLYGSQCLLDCPNKYYVDTIQNKCLEAQAQILSFSFLFMFASVSMAVLLVVLSLIITKNKQQNIDILYSLISAVEFVNRLCLLGNLWVKSNVFALAVCFMCLIATCAVAVFFNFLFMSPIYAHSPHFRSIYKRFTLSYQAVTCVSYFVGVSAMRLLCSNFLGMTSLQANLNQFKFFLVPLNTMSNFTAIFHFVQTGLCVYVVLMLSEGTDAWALGILGLFTNIIILGMQFYKHLATRTFLVRHSK